MSLAIPLRQRRATRPITVALNRGSMFAPGLRSWWPLTSGTSGADLVGPNTLTYQNGAYDDPRLGAGVVPRFDGTDDHLRNASVVGLPLIEGVKTIACRLWIDPSLSTPSRYIAAAFVKDDGASANNAISVEIANISGGWGVRIYGWGGPTLASKWFLPYNTGQALQVWRDVVYTWDGTTHRLYLDGSERDSTTTAHGETGAIGVVRVASFNGAFPSPYYKGWVTDVLIADQVWTPAQAYAWSHPATRWDLYQQPSPKIWIDGPAGAGAGRTTRNRNTYFHGMLHGQRLHTALRV